MKYKIIASAGLVASAAFYLLNYTSSPSYEPLDLFCRDANNPDNWREHMRIKIDDDGGTLFFAKSSGGSSFNTTPDADARAEMDAEIIKIFGVDPTDPEFTFTIDRVTGVLSSSDDHPSSNSKIVCDHLEAKL